MIDLQLRYAHWFTAAHFAKSHGCEVFSSQIFRAIAGRQWHDLIHIRVSTIYAKFILRAVQLVNQNQLTDPDVTEDRRNAWRKLMLRYLFQNPEYQHQS